MPIKSYVRCQHSDGAGGTAEDGSLFLPGQPALEFTRIYDSTYAGSGFLGWGWRHSFNECLRWEDRRVVYDDGFGSVAALVADPESGGLANESLGLRLTNSDGLFILEDAAGSRRHFPPLSNVAPGAESRVAQIADKYGNSVVLRGRFGAESFTAEDQIGRSLIFERDSRGLLRLLRATSRDEAAASDIRYEYDGHGRLIAVIDPIGRVTNYEYDKRLLVRETAADGSETFWRYDDGGRCIETWRTGGVLYRRLEYDDRRKRVLVTNSLGYATLYQLDDQGLILNETDPLGRMTEVFYDENGLMIASSTNGQSEANNAVYDESANCVRENLPYGNWTYRFDERGQLARAADENGGEWRFEYDARGDVTRQEHPGGVGFRAEYAPNGWVRRVTSQSGYAIEQERTSDRRRIKLFDQFGVLCRMELDGWGALSRVFRTIRILPFSWSTTLPAGCGAPVSRDRRLVRSNTTPTITWPA